MIQTFKLLDEDRVAIGIAGYVAHLLLGHPAATPREIIGLGNALLALERMPRTTPGVQAEFGVTYQYGDDDFREMRYILFRISEEAFEISRGGSQYDRSVGSDSISLPGWLIEIGGYRCTECDLYQLEDEVCEFINLGARTSVMCESAVNIDDLDKIVDEEE